MKKILILLSSMLVCTGCFNNENKDNSASSTGPENSSEIINEETTKEDECAGYFIGTQIPYYTGVVDEEEGMYCIIKSEILDVQLIDVSEDNENLIWYLRGVNKSNQNPGSSFEPAKSFMFVSHGAYVDGVQIPDTAVRDDLDGSEINMDDPVLFHVKIKKKAIPKYKDSIDDLGKIEINITVFDDPRGQVKDSSLLSETLVFPHEVES